MPKTFPVKIGDRGEDVRHVQEWLCLHGITVELDGRFGPATRGAVERFQADHHIKPTGIVAKETWSFLESPLTRATMLKPSIVSSLGQLNVAIARRHLAEHPREIGGQNMGPWVRHYMKGKEGVDYPWCAGFVCSVIRQACKVRGVKMPIPDTVSCDEIARHSYLHMSIGGRPEEIKPGSVFLLKHRKRVEDWIHTGIVTAMHNDHFETIEGNTNAAGQREGIDVRARVRAYGRIDFVSIN